MSYWVESVYGTEGIILSVPNYLVIFRSYEPLSRKRVIECLMSPYGYESRIKVNYAEAHIFTHENMAIRESSMRARRIIRY